jgi:hypothetical protein
LGVNFIGAGDGELPHESGAAQGKITALTEHGSFVPMTTRARVCRPFEVGYADAT